MKITGSLVVCVTAAAFTATTLLINPDPSPRPTAAAAAAGSPSEITISQFAFNAVTTAAGATVTVSNLDGVDHTVSATDGSFDSGVVASGGALVFIAPSTPGVYSFVCAIHPSMSGQLTVQA